MANFLPLASNQNILGETPFLAETLAPVSLESILQRGVITNF